MAVVFTEIDNAGRFEATQPGRRVTIIGLLNLGTHAALGVAVTPAIINAGIADTNLYIDSIVYIKALGRTKDLTGQAHWIPDTAKMQLALEDGTSGIHADAGTADLSSANKSFHVEVVATRAL